MKCPDCGNKNSKVVDSRNTDLRIRRRRECEKCGGRFTTYEEIESLPLMVIKKNGSIEPFNRQKLLERVLLSTAKRPVQLSVIEKLVDNISLQIKNSLVKEISSVKIGEAVLERLKNIDTVAYIRFASVYREFSDKESFIRVINEISNDMNNKL
jgi:transcriptional repressor NrdR